MKERKGFDFTCLPFSASTQETSIRASWLRCISIFLFIFLFIALDSDAQDEIAADPTALKKLSVEELMNVEVTLVSRTPQKLTEAASAIQVITGEDIRRSGATNVPEALRLVTNLQVAQLNANAWIISARGFNTIFANKLLVMIDGRTVYTPLFGGVIWEMQHVLLEDIERIEVVSGPGGSLWGANAVNGVINIITKSSKDTQGLFLSALAGDFVKDHVALRFGGKAGNKFSYKVYGQHFDRNTTYKPDGKRNDDAWLLTQGGFRMDWNENGSNEYTIQGDIYNGRRKTPGDHSDFNGQNILGRWTHYFSDRSDLQLQFYFDRYYWVDAPTASTSREHTYDLDFQYRFQTGKRHNIMVGSGYRRVKDYTHFNTTTIGILPENKNLDLFSAFIQDEISLSPRVKLTVGSKLLHNVYTGFELQPTIRAAVNVAENNMLWSAVSRAVRTPSRFDVDYFLPVTPQPPSIPSIAGGPNFVSEKVTSYELGYRMQPTSRLTFSVAGFYNSYDDLYSVEPLPGTLTYQIQNGTEGTSWGAELFSTFQLGRSWRLRTGYTYFDKTLKAKPGHDFQPDYLGNDVRNQFLLQSMINLSPKLHFDVVGRYLDYLPKTNATELVPAYVTADVRLAFNLKGGEISVAGKDLFSKRHSEFQTLQIPRSIYAKLTFKL